MEKKSMSGRTDQTDHAAEEFSGSLYIWFGLHRKL